MKKGNRVGWPADVMILPVAREGPATDPANSFLCIGLPLSEARATRPNITIELTRLDTRQGVCFTPRAPSKRLDGGPNRVQRFVMFLHGRPK